MSIHVIANATPYVRRSEHNTDSMVIGLGLGGIARYITKQNNLPSVMSRVILAVALLDLSKVSCSKWLLAAPGCTRPNL